MNSAVSAKPIDIAAAADELRLAELTLRPAPPLTDRHPDLSVAGAYRIAHSDGLPQMALISTPGSDSPAQKDGTNA